MSKRVFILRDKVLAKEPVEIFGGFIDGNKWLPGADLTQSRSHHQYNRIYSSLVIHPTLSSSETQGRYYVYEIIHDSGDEGQKPR